MKIKTGKYQHYKGKFYNIIGQGIHSETLEKFVVYQAMYNSKEFGKNAIWLRQKNDFFNKVKVNGKMIQRFKYISKT
jgi:hypothetical protein